MQKQEIQFGALFSLCLKTFVFVCILYNTRDGLVNIEM